MTRVCAAVLAGGLAWGVPGCTSPRIEEPATRTHAEDGVVTLELRDHVLEIRREGPEAERFELRDRDGNVLGRNWTLEQLTARHPKVAKVYDQALAGGLWAGL